MDNLIKITIAVLLSLLFYGCNPDNPQPNPNSINVSWQATINGISYSYSAIYGTSNIDNNPGDCFAGPGSIQLLKGNLGYDLIHLTFSKPPPIGVGNNTINPTSIVKCVISRNNQVIGMSEFPNTDMNLTVTEYSSIGGLIKGNFSGVIGTSSNGDVIPISGQFQAFRVN
jgi:hypothetical protein